MSTAEAKRIALTYADWIEREEWDACPVEMPELVEAIRTLAKVEPDHPALAN